jgi:hypothetical protein
VMHRAGLPCSCTESRETNGIFYLQHTPYRGGYSRQWPRWQQAFRLCSLRQAMRCSLV